MKYIDIHSHMTSRTTDDYRDMALTGAVAVCEPSFWAGYDRTSPDVFEDYFEHLTTFEPARAAQYSIQHYTLLGLNPKEADNRHMAKDVLDGIENIFPFVKGDKNHGYQPWPAWNEKLFGCRRVVTHARHASNFSTTS